VFSVKIKAMAYYDKSGLVILGFHDGKVESFQLNITPDSENNFMVHSGGED
jgi:hypothetical protein